MKAFDSGIKDDFINADLGDDPVYTIVYNVVLLAVRDFRRHDRMIHNEKKPYKKRERAYYEKQQIIKFFKSDWYSTLMSACDNVGNTGMILDKLLQESEELYGTEFEFKFKN